MKVGTALYYIRCLLKLETLTVSTKARARYCIAVHFHSLRSKSPNSDRHGIQKRFLLCHK